MKLSLQKWMFCILSLLVAGMQNTHFFHFRFMHYLLTTISLTSLTEDIISCHRIRERPAEAELKKSKTKNIIFI